MQNFSKVFKFLGLVLFCLFETMVLNAQNNVYRTEIFKDDIKTLQIRRVGEKYTSNSISLKSDEKLNISFDQLSHEVHSYSYRIFHCNADWKQSNLASTEYLDGFASSDITDYNSSTGTTVLYTNYKFQLPNDYVKFKISGNYLVTIYEDNDVSKPVANVCVMVYEPKVTIIPTLRYNTDIELNGRFQQLDIDINTSGLKIQVPQNEIKLVVRQNSRIDNEVRNLEPTYINGSVLSYKNNKNLIFEGGYEFHSFDISSVYAASRGVDKIKYVQPGYEVYLLSDKIKPLINYNHEFDANGKFIINYQESVTNVDTEADYMNVNFCLLAKEPFLDGRVIVGGDFNYNLSNDKSVMKYDFDNKFYVYKALLKQGGYNYQYRFLQKGNNKLNIEKIEGSFWQTTNEYAIFIYYRPVGGYYDQLVGLKYLEK